MPFVEKYKLESIDKSIKKSIKREGNYSLNPVKTNDSVRIHLTAWIAKPKSEKPFYK